MNDDEHQILKLILDLIKIKSHHVILDIACGRGKSILANNSEYVIGVDIKGYPQEIAQINGYKELAVYAPPEYYFSLSRKADVISCINLNAHIHFEYFSKILGSCLEKINSDGYLILLNEYDNQGPSYKYF